MFLILCFVSLLNGCVNASGVGLGLNWLNSCSLNKPLCICFISSFIEWLKWNFDNIHITLRRGHINEVFQNAVKQILGLLIHFPH